MVEKNETQPKVENKEVEDFINKFDLALLLPPQFTTLEENQKLKVIYDLKRRIVDIVKSDAQTQYSEELSKKSAFKKIWGSISREGNLKNLETEAFKKLKDTTEGKELIKKDLEILTQKTKEKPIYINTDGTPEIIYIDANNTSQEEFEAGLDFNRKANEFTKIPYEWGQEKSGKHKKIYDKAGLEYKTAKENILKIRIQEKQSDKNKIFTEILEIDNAVQMEQLLNTHPEFEKELNDFERSAGGKEMIKNAGNFLQTITGGKNLTNKLITAGGFGARTLAKGAAAFSGATIITAIAAPVIGGTIGYWRGSLRAKDELIERKKGARHGKNDESKEATNIENAENLNNRMVTMLEAVENAQTREQYEKKLGQIKRRIEYTQGKLADGLVNFGDSKTALNNQYNLINNLNRALTVSASLEKTTRKDIDERLERFLSYKDEKISKLQKEFIKKQAKKGMIYGASFALAGYSVRALGEHFGWWGNSGEETFSQKNDPTENIESQTETVPITESMTGPKNIPEEITETTKDTPTKMSYEEATKEIEKAQNTTPEELKAKLEEKSVEVPKPTDVTKPETIKPVDISVIQKGEGIEHAFRRQIEADTELAKSLGFKGDVNDTKALHEFSGKAAHRVALEHGYVDKITGEEIRVKNAGEVAYKLKLENGELKVDEMKAEGGLIERNAKGSEFEKDIEKYEYKHTKSLVAEDITVSKTIPSSYIKVNAEDLKAKIEAQMDASGNDLDSADENTNNEQLSQALRKQGYTGDPTNREAVNEFFKKLRSDSVVDQTKITNKIETPSNTIRTGTDIGIGRAVRSSYGEGGRNYFYDSRFRNMNIGNTPYYFQGLSPSQNEFLNRNWGFFRGNPYDLSGAQLIETYDFFAKTMQHYLDHGGEEQEWLSVRNLNAKKFLNDENLSSEYGPIKEYLEKLKEVTKPKGWGIFNKPETVESFMSRAIQKLVKEGGLQNFEKSLGR